MLEATMQTLLMNPLIWLASVSTFPCAVQRDDVPPKPVDGSIEWVYSYEDGKRKARDSGKPMFVVFRCER
jgi:hypothetical protein